MFDRTTIRSSKRLFGNELFGNLMHPPWSDRRFWTAQMLVVTVGLIHLGADIAQDRGIIPVPGFVWILLLLVPVVYAGLTFGMVGSLCIALVGIVVMIPTELFLPHTIVELWGAWSIYAMALIIAIVIGFGVERSRMEIVARTAAEVSVKEEQRFRLAFDENMIAMTVADLEGYLLRVNRPLCEMLGYSKEELTGTSFLDYTHLDDRTFTVAMNLQLVAGELEQVRYTKRILRKDGGVVFAEVLRSLAKDQTGAPIYIVASLRDLTREKNAEREIAESEQRFRLAFESNMAGMVLHDRHGLFLDANQAFCEIVGYSVFEMAAKGSSLFLHPEDGEVAALHRRRLLSGEEPLARTTRRYLHKSGRVVHVEVSRSVARDEIGRPMFFVTSVRDITAERTLSAQLSHQALHDPLTGLPNRTLLQDRIAQAHDRVIRHGGHNALLLLDVDDFKGVNDTFGHHVGDQLLIALSRRLEKEARSSDTLCRFAGDEFVYLAEGLDSAANAEEVARRLIGVLDEPFALDGSIVERSASMGVVVWDATSDKDYNELIQDADTAMYEAKRRGKARYILYTADMSERASTRFKLAQELGQALAHNEISLYYQPIVELATGEIVGYEALMRWCHPERGWVSPEVFIPIAEQSDLILELGSFALGEAVKRAAVWGEATPDTTAPYVAVNLSARHFHDSSLLPMIEEAIASSNLASGRLVLEITESVALLDIDSAIRVIEHLKHLGVALALDDFGTGYSSFSYLARLHPEIIKIDRSFVSPVLKSPFAERTLEAIVSLCHVLDMTALAEGIETPAQLDELRRLGCDLGQGYLFSHAVPAGKVAETYDIVLHNWKGAVESSSY
ncbi:MAG: sensor domain-containing protein [Ferrimicrobium sp.]